MPSARRSMPPAAAPMRDPSTEPLDLLAVGAHPDDAELFAGGTLALLARRGRRVGLLHLTRGECGTRGTPATRLKESSKAARILGAAEVARLDLGDGRLENSNTSRRAVAAELRRLRPRVVVTHFAETRHPDHGRAHELVRDACFLANVGGYEAEGARWKVEELLYFIGHEGRSIPKPDWIVDTSEVHALKLKALQAYSTQFFNKSGAGRGPSTYLASPEFWDEIDRRSRRWGHLIGARHGEPFIFAGTPNAAHPFIRMLVP